jgi:hypothetical protein
MQLWAPMRVSRGFSTDIFCTSSAKVDSFLLFNTFRPLMQSLSRELAPITKDTPHLVVLPLLSQSKPLIMQSLTNRCTL